MSDRLRFGIFMAPFHRAGENPTLAMRVFPHFQGQAYSTLDAKARAREGRTHLAERNMQAVTDMTEKHAAELAAKDSYRPIGGGQTPSDSVVRAAPSS